MDEAARHYYRAVVWFYASDSPHKALDELYRALEHRVDHEGALILAEKIGGKKTRSLPFAEVPEEETLQLLSFLEVQDRDRFFSALLSREDIGDFAMRQIYWEDWERIFAKSPRRTDRIWYLILRQNWETARSVWQQSSEENHGNVVAYFQIGYIFFANREFEQAEPYFTAMLPFGGIYRICAIRMLAQLPQRRFSSLVDVPGAFDKADVDDLFAIAAILQNSWDDRAFARTLSYLAKKVRQGEDHLRLARFYRNENEQKQAISHLYHAYKQAGDHSNLLEIVCFAKTLPEKYRTRFFKWAFRRTKQQEALWELANTARELAPKVALAIYRKLEKKGDPGKVKLGKAIAFLHLNNFKKAEITLAEVAVDFPDLAIDASVWKARLLSRQEKYAEALEMLQNALEKSPKNSSALLALKELGRRCPVCYTNKDAAICPRCGYRSLQTYSWDQDRLRWNGKKLFFPLALVLFTTDSQCYSCEQPVHLIVFSTCSQEVQITFRHGDKVVREKRIGVTSGLLVVREESFSTGLYNVTVEPDRGTANRHFFLVARTQAVLRLSLKKPRYSEDAMEASVKVRDILGFPLSGSIEIQSFSPFSSWHNSSKVECREGEINCAWHLTQCRESIVIVATTEDGKRGCTIASPYNFFTEGELKEVVTQYQRALQEDLPLTLEKLTGDQAAIIFEQPQQEVVIALQPITRGAIEIHRFREVQGKRPVTFPLKPSLAGFYLGTTRFYPGRYYQQTGLEMCGLFMGSLPELSLSGKNRVAPGEKFTVTITANKRVKGILLSCSEMDFYHPLSSYFLQKMADVLSDETSKAPCQQDFPTDFSITREQERDVDLQLFTACPIAEVTVTARADTGQQQIVCIASDGSFFAERDMKVEVFDSCWLKADFPGAIGMGDCIEKEIRYYSDKNARLQVSSAVHGVLHDRVVQGENEISVSIASPDTIEASIATVSKSYKVVPLEMAPATSSRLYFLDAQEQWLQKKATVYAKGLELAEDISTALLADPHQDTETIAAKIYCAARLYQASVKSNDSSKQWERKIFELEENFRSCAKEFPDARWGYHIGFLPDKKITEEVLHHLSPFLEMPRFGELHQLAKKTLAAALGWKISSNRLFFLSLMFQEPKLKTAEAAAGALQYDFQPRKALKFLRRACKDRNNPHWRGKSLGGKEQTTALVGRAYQEHGYPVKNIFAYFKNRLRHGVLSNPPATVAFVDALLGMSQKPAEIITGNGTMTLEGKTEMESAFGVAKGQVWCREDISTVNNLTEGFSSAPLKILWEGPSEVRRGDEFVFSIATGAVKYPYLELLIPPNAVVCRGTEIFRGHMVWPCPARKIRIVCKAACIGMAHFHFLLQDRYDSERKLMKKYPVVVVR